MDTTFKIFGADTHNYLFNNVLSESELIEFERKHQFTLPSDYRDFILTFGNGGCGPYFGLFQLETGIYDLPQNKKQSEIISLSKPFRFNEFWNLEELSQDYDLWESQYDLCKWIDGMLRIGHIGSGSLVNMIVSGPEKGNIWIDDRVSEGGIYPFGHHSGKNKTSFLEWYLDWVENSILACQ